MILDDIAAATQKRVASKQNAYPLKNLRADVEALVATQIFAGDNDNDNKNTDANADVLPFEKALAGYGGRGNSSIGEGDADDIAFICEVKKASPSKGLIAADFPYLKIAGEYKNAGAAAISVLTEPDFFLGSDEYLREIAHAVSLPVLRKDFVIDPYMIYEAKMLGASAVLLICALLDDAAIRDFLEIARSLRLAALVETHNEAEVESALQCGARIIGVNNRDLQTFTVSLEVSRRLRPLVPRDKIFVAESGINTAADIKALRDIKADAVLIGEAMMKAPDKKVYLQTLAGVDHEHIACQ